MIYPSAFPETSDNKAEKLVFEKLNQLADKYDIFYSRRFISLSSAERPEYEIDFIICIPCKGILCLEVKGGVINFDGVTGKWLQNSKPMVPGPDAQASSAAHSLLRRYTEISKLIPIGWALCFPDCEVPNNSLLPTSIKDKNLIDQKGLLYLESSLSYIFQQLFEEYEYKTGSKHWQYDNFKSDLLRGIGFVQTLGTRMKHDEEKFVQLADQQLAIFKYFIDNPRILVQGPAGSGKTLIAKTLAQELATQGQKSMLLCFNRTLANKLSYEPGIRGNINIINGSYHSFAKRFIESKEPEWWQNINKDSSEFWDIEVPAKLYSLTTNEDAIYDCIIIDEGQDFKEFWFDCLYKFLSNNGRIIIFLDKLQDIFNRETEIPQENSFFKVSLHTNCRNTKAIVKYLEEIVGQKIETRNLPDGENLTLERCKNEIELQNRLISDIQNLINNQLISCDQMLIILNSEKKSSSISSLNKVGKLDLKSLDNKARFEKGTIHFTTIDMFKGLEADIVFIIDAQKIEKGELKRKLYTEASRAKHKLYVYEIS